MQLEFLTEKKAEFVTVIKPCKWCKRSRGYCLACGNRGSIPYAKLITVDVLECPLILERCTTGGL